MREPRKRAEKQVWIYSEDYEYIKTYAQYGNKFADGLKIVIDKFRGKKE